MQKKYFRKQLKAFIAMLFLPWNLGTASYADSNTASPLKGGRYESVRSAALGDPSLGLGEDVASALFLNPALLAKIRKSHLELFHFSSDVNNGYIQALDTRFYQVINLKEWAPILKNHPNHLSQVGFTFIPTLALSWEGWTIGLGASLQTRLRAESDGENLLTYQSLYQFIPSIGIGWAPIIGFLKIGYSLQWVNQASGKNTIDTTTNPINYTYGLGQGSALSQQMGLEMTLPKHIALQLVLRNIGGTQFHSWHYLPGISSTSQNLPQNESMQLDISCNLTTRIDKSLRLTGIFSYPNITHAHENILTKQISIGVELGYREKFFIRSGWKRGYFMGGIGLKNTKVATSISIATEFLPDWNTADTRFLIQYQVKTF